MAMIKLSYVRINDAADTTSWVTLTHAGALTQKPAIPGAVQVLAGDRRRLALTGSMSTDWDVSSPYVDPTTVAWLTAHIGTPVWVRDWLGGRVYGAYLASGLTVRMDGSGRYDVSLTVSELTEPA